MGTRKPFRSTVALLACAIAAACEPGGPTPPATGAAAGAIVNGQDESGWPAVGALVMDVNGWGYIGAYCSGSLIAPRWVLTAGHCVTPQAELPVMAAFVQFYVGSDARGSHHSGPKTGKMYQAKDLYPHPQYDPSNQMGGYDIGLVELEADVPGVDPVPLNTGALRGSLLGTQVLYVGFGESDGTNQTGSGVKRSTHMPLTSIANDAYYATPAGSGTCFGDSGGPGLLDDGAGLFKVIGVVSAGTGSTGTGDPCLGGYGIYTRVDAYAAWIVQTTGIVLPSCKDEGTCFCPDACQPDGSCDATKCQTADCPAGLRCYQLCPAGDGGGCALDCQFGAAAESQVAVSKINYCLSQHCPATTEDTDACAAQHCGEQLDQCMAKAKGEWDCRSYDSCRQACHTADTLCLHACDVEAPDAVRAAWDAVSTCLRDRCGTGTDAASLADPCASDQCGAEVGACFPPPCDLAGGTCPDGLACTPGEAGAPARCAASGGVLQDQPCTPGDPPPCADGLACLGDEGAKTCVRLCHEAAGCGEGSLCVPGAIDGVTDVGRCVPGSSGEGAETAAEAFVEDAAGGGASPGGAASASGAGCSGGSANGLSLAVLALLAAASLLGRRRDQVPVT